MSDFVVRRFDSRQGFGNSLPEPVIFEPDRPYMLGWTEEMLDKLGIAFPVSVSLHGPVLVPSADGVVPVWYATDFRWLDDLTLTDGAVRVVDALMGGLSVDELLSFDDKRFLSWFYPMWEDASVNHSKVRKEVVDV
jgi:hypothetical protein